MSDAHDHHDDDYYVHAHITPVKTYVGILGALLFLTFLTVLAYNIRLGELNLTVAVAIATVKATLVGAWFMHLKYEQRFNIVFFVGSLLFVSIFFLYTFNDTEHRGRQHSVLGAKVDPATGEYAQGTPPIITEAGGEFTPIPNLGGEGETDEEPSAE